MQIRPLKENEYEQAIHLRINYWTEELAGVCENNLKFDEELAFFSNWIKSADRDQDIRLVYGIFEDDSFLGFIGASIAEESDSKNGVELNYLFIETESRGKGLSLRLMDKIISEFQQLGYEELIVYNHHYAPSNQYYRKLGGNVVRQVSQGKDNQLLIDMFVFDLRSLMDNIQKKIS